MAESSEAPLVGTDNAGVSEHEPETSESSKIKPVAAFDPNKMRRTKPGTKRLILIISVLFSFLLGLPFLLKSVEIYRAPLPFRAIDSLLNRIESNPVVLPCRFQVVFVGSDVEEFSESRAEKIELLILDRMRKLTGSDPVSGGCGNNYTVSVIMETGKDCIHNRNAGNGCLWRCGEIDFSAFGDNLKDDEAVDELVDSVLRSDVDCTDSGGKVYTVVMMHRDEGARVVVGKHRHAWILGKVEEIEAVSMISEIFVKFFMNGGKKDESIQPEFMPVGVDGRVVLSFSLLNADPHDWIYDWDFQMVDEIILAPVVEALAPIANISVESQVLYHTPKSSFAQWDEKLASYIFTTKDLPFFVNSNEWHLDTSIAAGGRSKVLQFVGLHLNTIIMEKQQWTISFLLHENSLVVLAGRNNASSGLGTSTVLFFAKSRGFLRWGSRSPSDEGISGYIPSANECPLLLRLPNGEISMTNGFISPMWGGVIIWNSPSCFSDSDSKLPTVHTLSSQDLHAVFDIFMGQIRQLFGLNSGNVQFSGSGISNVLVSERGFTEWELDILSRRHTYFNLLSCATTLGSLSRLVQSLPRMIIMDEIGKQVKYSLEAATLAQSNSSLGIYDASAASSRQARTLAEDAFFHPSIMSISYYSFEHFFAIYTPFFLPVSLHVLLAAIKEWKRYKLERVKYLEWKANAREL